MAITGNRRSVGSTRADPMGHTEVKERKGEGCSDVPCGWGCSCRKGGA